MDVNFCVDPGSGSDFKLDAFLAAPCETFDPHYGEYDYSKSKNMYYFSITVKRATIILVRIISYMSVQLLHMLLL